MKLLKQKQSGFVSPASASTAPPGAAAAPADVARGLRSLRLFMACCALAALGLFAAFAAYRYDQIHDEAALRVARSLGIAHEHALRVLDTNDTLIQHVLQRVGTTPTPGLREQQAALYSQLVEMGQGKPQLQSIWLHGEDGRPIATNRFAQAPVGRDISSLPYFKWHAARGGGVFASGLMKTDDGARFFNISRGRYMPDGAFAGLVSVGLHSSYFTRFHQDLVADEPGLAITLFRSDGVVYSRWPQLPGAPERMSATGEVLSRVLKGETTGTVENVSSLDGKRRVIMFRKLGDYPIYIGTGRDLGAIDAAWLREMAIIAGLGMLPVLGVMYAAYLAMKRTREALETARRLQEESLARRQAEEALLQSQKMEALGRLTGGVAHDFNNVLMVISGNVHLLRRTQQGTPSKYTEAIARAVESATKLTRQLLAFSRRQALSPQTLLLQEQLPALRDLLLPTLGSKIALGIEVAPDTHPIHVDPADLELGLINLAVNARDAMPDGGSFSITARNDADEPSRVLLEAADTGEGMPPDVAARAFDPFFTTKPLGKGTGLGLSQVSALCKRAGGDVQLQSERGKGTAIRMLFPASQAAPSAAQPADAAPARFDRSVLLVEDNAEVAAVVLPVLQGLGCRVKHIENADAALGWLDVNASSVDLLLTDVVMPGQADGIALAREAKARFPAVKVLLMTGYAEQIESIGMLGFAVLPKPFSPKALTEALEKVFA